MMNLQAGNGPLTAVDAYFRRATLGLRPELKTHQCANWGRKQKEVAHKVMAYLGEVLSGNTLLAGKRFSVSNITVFAG
ncbi:hypothetical protein [uncultured Tateyamaria sp.]|uniref:hypothetical protein n=1 Tax=uncultured Tateyamaria sp. TaxID=455651 RepID=UPI002615F386|nr:hypothetical protein [uncultured Tateyamaria sp.]